VGNTPKVQGDRRARAAAARKAAEAAERRRRLVVTSAVVAVVVIVVGVLVGVSLAGGGGKSGSSASGSSSSAAPSGGPQTGTATLPPWPAPTGAAADAAIASSGLQAFGTEMLKYHIHAHLDVIDDGKPVTVPPGIGFVYKNANSNQPTGLTSLHTHQPDGIIHIEADKPVTYTLGMFFKEWAVPLSTQCVGKLCADANHTLGFYVDGKKVTSDPSQIPLKKHEEIAIVYAKKGSTVKPPSSFSFPNGL
jgi:hypothetical protein